MEQRKTAASKRPATMHKFALQSVRIALLLTLSASALASAQRSAQTQPPLSPPARCERIQHFFTNLLFRDGKTTCHLEHGETVLRLEWHAPDEKAVARAKRIFKINCDDFNEEADQKTIQMNDAYLYEAACRIHSTPQAPAQDR